MSTVRKRTEPEPPAQDSGDALGTSQPSSPGSAPSTLAESLRSYWEARRGSRRTTAQLLRSLHRIGTRVSARGLASGKQAFVRGSVAVNASVSRLVGLVVRDFVREWYEKVTDDGEFTTQVTLQLEQVANEIERRCGRVDWVRFVLFELPEVVHLHVRDAQQCMARLGTVYVGRESSIEAAFQSMQPHVALAQAADSELVYLRHLSHEVLHVLMPPEAQDDEVAHHLLREILACAVLRNVVDAVADPSTLNEGIVRAVGRYSRKSYFSEADMSRYVTQPMRIDDDEGGPDAARPGGSVASATSDAQAGSASVTVETMLREAQTTRIGGQGGTGGKRAGASADQTEPAVDSRPSNASRADAEEVVGGVSEDNAGGGSGTVTERLSSQLSFASWWLLSDLYSQARWRGWKNNTLRGLVYLHLIVTQAFSRIFTMFSEYTFSLNQLWHPDGGPDGDYRGAIEPVLGLLNAALLLDRYNQWVWVQFVFYIFPLVNLLAGAAIDRTLVKVVRFLISGQQIAVYVDMVADTLWKAENGGRFKGGNRPYKTLAQQKQLKVDAEELVAELLPYVAAKFFYGLSEQDRVLAAQRILEPFENRQLNKHLVYNVLDAIVGKITPELQEPKQPQ